MSKYQHTKGQIRDNAIQALLHDPLFRQRIEQKQKGKGSFKRKEKHGKGAGWEGSDKKASYHCPSAFTVKKPPERRLINYTRVFCCFSRSRISVSNTSSFDGFATGFSTSFFLYKRFINLIAMKIAKAMITKSKMV